MSLVGFQARDIRRFPAEFDGYRMSFHMAKEVLIGLLPQRRLKQVAGNHDTRGGAIAGRAVMPEFPFVGLTKLHARRMADILDGWISEPETQTAARRVLMRLKSRVAQTGGVDRAAEAISRRVWAGESTVIELPVKAAA